MHVNSLRMIQDDSTLKIQNGSWFKMGDWMSMSLTSWLFWPQLKPRNMTYSLGAKETADLFAFPQSFWIHLPMQRCNVSYICLFGPVWFLLLMLLCLSNTCRQTHLHLLHFEPVLLYPFGIPMFLYRPWIRISIVNHHSFWIKQGDWVPTRCAEVRLKRGVVVLWGALVAATPNACFT